ncbi:bifunctional DNA-formamidopyrimidine glycosylase/DNA-(apurinic or apyrimidinic site) lyase [Rubellimicrobium sp. CFH 75288]|uniref:bifunctional DNA-formamidopyrimidine glycosylase/DNA-(apurinic or apyrimidinic site) lyase n=1 Tax=Rubellimicrobium sp. CFH 75288 TaxID=2697034 RepID=UPI001411C4AA|nr:bifunctional DNA-formamidopyrimidine glycosylase/DNA-(apurinic or apyrimidinic site) lyase [Rubellimicrobium sp. CFH 75288]NAZ37308.1 bifunctional DNA-formamidopyrimidine glycosylase/DNA-(apurinic or apyrimidinic site) lyase [Rubellimicrobium sp. CFH 75288]
MPELPEVETVRRGLLPALEGRRIERLELRRDGLRWPFPPDLAGRVAGARIVGIDRRAKVLLIHLDTGETLLAHLGMSGRMLLGREVLGTYVHGSGAGAPDSPHDHVVLHLEGGTRVTFNDARRFGMIDLWPTAALSGHRLLAGLGPEPLEEGFGGASLQRALAGRRTSIKAALLDAATVAGIGNIYACEALARAGIHPARPAGRIGRARLDRLAEAIRAVLHEAIAAGGSSLRDHRGADGEIGRFQHGFGVYGREGQPCRTCTTPIRRIVQAGRSTFFCPKCQR